MTERLNADYSLPASIRYSELQFIPSPSPHVTRGMLDRVGGEVARASTLVRYASDSSFPAHVHSGGEEFIVLEGEFADEHGEYPSGTYIRNPVGSRHSPSVGKDGCLIFVKLRWMRTPEEPYVLYNVDNGDLRTESPYILDKKSGLAPIETGGKGDARNAVTMYHCPSSTSGTERVRAIKLTKEHPSYEIDAEEVASGVFRNSLLRSLPFIDPDRMASLFLWLYKQAGSSFLCSRDLWTMTERPGESGTGSDGRRPARR
jgi:hypothetical protein